MQANFRLNVYSMAQSPVSALPTFCIMLFNYSYTNFKKIALFTLPSLAPWDVLPQSFSHVSVQHMVPLNPVSVFVLHVF